jgi:hypothetical protein
LNRTRQNSREIRDIEFKNIEAGSIGRYALFNGANGDLQYYNTNTANDPIASGWGYDGIVGDVCSP